jgi:hypothetical protein
MRKSVWLITFLLLAGCHSETQPGSEPNLIEASPFSNWPSVTCAPVELPLALSLLCLPTPEETQKAEAEVEAQAKRQGPHAKYSIIVRVSPEAIAPFREGKALPTGAVVAKEKYVGVPPVGQLHGYAVMTKREAGYYPEGGDWEYEYVARVPERKETRGRLANCAACHASAKERDFLFRSYGSGGR